MNINSLFSIDLILYDLLLTPKVILTVLKNRKSLKIAKRNKIFEKSQTGKTIYICGNGPSLNKVNFREIKDDYLVLNDFYRFEEKDLEHPPKYYMILDEDYLLKSLSERYYGVFNPGFDTTYLINGVMREQIEKDFPDKKNIYYFCPWGKLFSSKKEYDFSKLHGRPWNVVSEAILFSIYAGYTDIKLVGCDYSVFATNAHFYAQVQKHTKLRDMLYKYCYTTQVHYEIAEYAQKKGIRIINMTKDTLLDAYPIDDKSQF